MPRKITARYSRMRGQTSPGTRRKTFIQSRRAKARRFRRRVRTPTRRKEARTLSRRASSSRWPKRMEKTAPLPMQSPSRMEVRKVMRVKAEPTAARALEPRNLPTIRVSAML